MPVRTDVVDRAREDEDDTETTATARSEQSSGHVPRFARSQGDSRSDVLAKEPDAEECLQDSTDSCRAFGRGKQFDLVLRSLDMSRTC